MVHLSSQWSSFTYSYPTKKPSLSRLVFCSFVITSIGLLVACSQTDNRKSITEDPPVLPSISYTQTPNPTATPSGSEPSMNFPLFGNVAQQNGESIPADPTVVRARLATVNFNLLRIMLAQSEGGKAKGNILLNLFDDAFFTCILDRVDSKSPNKMIWLGHIQDVPDSQVILAVEDNVMAGNIRVPGKFYQVRFLKEGVHVIYQIDQSRFPNPEEPR